MRDAVWWRVAWRNLWRNRGRTLVTASGLAFGYLSAVVLVGLTDGMSAELIENGTRLLVGQVQIHAPDYLPERSVYRTLGGDEGTDVADLLARIEAEPDVASAAPRLYGGGLVSAGERTEAGIFMGVDPVREPTVSTLLSNLVDGHVPVDGTNEIAVGTEMARLLGIEVGHEVVLVAPAADGSMGNDLFTVAGIFRTGTPGIDAAYVVLPLPDLQYLMALDPGRIHEIALDVVRPWDTPAIAATLEATLSESPPSLSVRPWTELRPELAESVSLMDSMNFIIVIIIFGMAVFGVANTMIIGTFERRKEFAVVRALGTTRTSVGRTVVYEGILLGILSLAAGALITLPIMVWWHNSPPDLSQWVGSFSWVGSQWRPLLRVEYSADAPIFSGVALFFTSILAAVVPAWRATRIPPADTLADR
ncbi:MAG TPA: ABC transporter permease [Longimicrobiales bacterium]|nr:ABC transporter permease [Longimicrobiales bacterium]